MRAGARRAPPAAARLPGAAAARTRRGRRRRESARTTRTRPPTRATAPAATDARCSTAAARRAAALPRRGVPAPRAAPSSRRWRLQSGALRRPQSCPYLSGMGAPCVLAWLASRLPSIGQRYRPGALVRRELRPPGTELLEGVPKRCLGRLLVERGVDVGDDERLDRRGEALELAHAPVERSRERELEPVHERERVVAHHDEQLRLDDVQLADQEPACLGFP